MKETFLVCAAVLALAAGAAGADLEDDIADAIETFASDNFELRFEAFRRIVEIGQPAAAQLIEVLSVDKVLVRSYACRALAGIGAPEARTPLQQTLENDDAASVRAAAAEALAAYNNAALDPLRKAASEDPVVYVRKSAAIAIASVHTKTAIDQLIWLLKGPDSEVGGIAADGLREITREDFGTDSDAWKKWWTDNRADFEIQGETPADEAGGEEKQAP